MRSLVLLLAALLLAPIARAVEITDASGNKAFTDKTALNISTAVSGDANIMTVLGQSTAYVQVTANSTTLQFEGTVAGGTFFSVPCVVPTTGSIVTSATSTGQWQCPIGGLATFRVRQSAAGASTSSVILNQGSNATIAATSSATNVSQFGGTNVSTGTGAGGAGIPRVTLSNDSSLAANQSVNVAQVAGTNTVTGGVAGIIAVGGNVANAVAATANPVPVGGIFTTTPATLTTGQTATAQYTSAQNLKTDGTTVAGTATITSAAGVQRVGIAGNANATLDAAGVNANAVPANSVMVAGGSIAGATNIVPVTVKAASTAAAATDTSLVVQPLVGNAVMSTAAAGVQKVGIVGNANGAVDAANNATAPANVLVTGLQLRDTTTAAVGTVGQVGSPAGSLDHVQYIRYGGPVTFSCFNEAITAQANCTSAASGASLFYYISTLEISNEAATVNTFDVVSSVNTGCTTPVALTHKFAAGTNATTTSPFIINVRFDPPIKCNAANCFLCVRPLNATAYGVTMTGYTAP